MNTTMTVQEFQTMLAQEKKSELQRVLTYMAKIQPSKKPTIPSNLAGEHYMWRWQPGW